MNKVFVILKGHGFIDQNGDADEVFVIHKIFSNLNESSKEDANKEAQNLFIEQIRILFESKKNSSDNDNFKDFTDFLKQCSSATYKNEHSYFNNFFISGIQDFYCYGFEDDPKYKKPECIIKVQQHYLSS